LDLAQPCIPWEGYAEPHGYCRIMVDGHKLYVHRLAYQLHVGPIPRGWEIDHVCHGVAVSAGTCVGGDHCWHRRCWNPAHLEAVTSVENSRRGNHPLFTIARRERCRRGHDLTDPANVYERADGRRRCRICSREGQRNRRAAK
jgi:hypothetical protein